MTLFYGLEPHEWERVPAYILEILSIFDEHFEGIDARFFTHHGHGAWQVDMYKTGGNGCPVSALWFEPEASA